MVFHCAECDLGFLTGSDTTADYYAGGYRAEVSHKAAGGGASPEETFAAYKNYQSDRVALVTERIGQGDVLEIGASAGQFLANLKTKTSCAIEPDFSYCQFMRSLGIDADNSLLPQSKFRDGRFDAVCAFQVMEHTDDPVEFLSGIREVVAEDGAVFIEVPNLYDPLLSVWGISQYNDFYYHQQHLFYFSEKSLRMVCEKAGFTVERIVYSQDYNLLNHLHWIMNKRPQDTGEIGLSKPCVSGNDKDIAAWLSDRLESLNTDYMGKLAESGKTSNITAVLRV